MDRDDLDELGPIDYLVVEFPGSRMTGRPLPARRLVDQGIIRILDLVFVKKSWTSSISGLAIADLDQDGKLDLAVFEGRLGPPGPGPDLDQAGGMLGPAARPGSSSTRTAGRAVRQEPPARRCPDGGQRPDPGPGPARLAGRRRDIAPSPDKEGAAGQDFFVGSRGRPWSPGRRPPCPTASPGGRPTAGPRRNSSRTSSRPTWEPPPAPEDHPPTTWTPSWPSSSSSARAEDPGCSARPSSRPSAGFSAPEQRSGGQRPGAPSPPWVATAQAHRDVQADHDRSHSGW